MPASSMEVFRLMERMHKALIDLSMWQSRDVVAEAVTRTAAAIVAGCAPSGHEADALTIGATIFVEKAAEQISATQL